MVCNGGKSGLSYNTRGCCILEPECLVTNNKARVSHGTLVEGCRADPAAIVYSSALSSWQTLSRIVHHVFAYVILMVWNLNGSHQRRLTWSAYLALYEERHDQQMQSGETDAHVRGLDPLCCFYGYTPVPLCTCVFNRQTFLAFYTKLPFSPGWRDKLSGDWTCGPALVCCWYAFYVLVFPFGTDQRVTATMCPRASRGLICW